MKMRKIIIYTALMLAALTSCAKDPAAKTDASKAYFDAWIEVNHPEAQATEMGVYILEDTPGTGETVAEMGNDGYIRLEFSTYDLNGKVSSTTSEELSKQVGSYSETVYYGPRIFSRSKDVLQIGLYEALKGMKVGGSRKVAIPGWLFTTAKYDSIDKYIKKSESQHALYDLKVVERIDDVKEWELNWLDGYVHYYYPGTDSLKTGFYYIQTQAPTKTEFPEDTTIYINYTGRLLNGRVFDTTIENTAKDYGLYKSSRSYKPIQINWKKEDYTKITMGSDESKLVEGFAYGLHQMRKYEKGIMFFYSGLGYGASASNSSIPEYSPLIFEVELVDQQ